MTYKLVLVGTGGIAHAHAEAVAALGDRARIVAAVDVVADRLAAFGAKHDIGRLYGDYSEALDGVPDADMVVLCTPPMLHKWQALAALARGLVVYCEKPPAVSLADLDEIIVAERGAEGSFATVFQQRYGGGAGQLRELIQAGALGRPTVAVCHTLWYREPAYFAVPWRGRWESEGGGPTMGHGIHQMDLLLSILGPWREVTAVAARLARETNTEDVSAALVTFDSGTVASVVNSLLSPRQTSYLRFDFDTATVELSHYDGYGDADWAVTGAPGHEAEVDRLWAAGRRGTRSGHLAQLRAVLDALDGALPPPVTTVDARNTIELSAAIYASAFTGHPVRRGDIDGSSPYYRHMAGEAAPWPALR
jgi:predicted dehydrogenase